MKKVLLLMAVLMLPMFLTAQDDEIDNLPFDNEPLRDDARTYFVLAGGVTYDWLMIDEKEMNSFIGSQGDQGLLLSAPLQLVGGQGVIGIPWVKNLRIGVFGYGGNLKSNLSVYKGVEIDGTPTGFDSEVQTSLTASMFGFSLHYGYVPFEHFAILGGLNTGWGDMNYEVYTAVIMPNPDAPQGFGIERFEKNYFFVMPNIQLEYAITSYIILRADASYNLTFAQKTDWKYNNLGTNSVNPDFNLNGMKVGFGVMVGLANF